MGEGKKLPVSRQSILLDVKLRCKAAEHQGPDKQAILEEHSLIVI